MKTKELKKWNNEVLYDIKQLKEFIEVATEKYIKLQGMYEMMNGTTIDGKELWKPESSFAGLYHYCKKN